MPLLSSLSLLFSTKLFSISIILSFQKCYIHRILWYVTFVFFSLSITLWRIIQVVVCINRFFLFLYATGCLNIHPLKNIWVFPVFGGYNKAIINSLIDDEASLPTFPFMDHAFFSFFLWAPDPEDFLPCFFFFCLNIL